MYKDRDWLYEQYVTNKKSTTEIAKMVGVSHKTISRWLIKLEIGTRDTQAALDVKYGNNQKSRIQKAIEYYVKGESFTTRKSKPTLNWKGDRNNGIGAQ